MRLRSKITTVLSLTVLFFFVQSHVIMALSLGPISVKSKPGEKFRAEVPIELESMENVDDLVVAVGNSRDYSLVGETMPKEIDKIRVTLLREGGIKALLYTDEVVESANMNVILRAVLNGGTMLKRYSLKMGQGISRVVGLAKEKAPSGIYGPVKAGETLSNIAMDLGYRGSDLYRAIVAVWLNNESDFVAGNLHGLKKGAVLKIASLEQDMGMIDAREARYVMVSQWEKWQKISRAHEDTIKTAMVEKVIEPVTLGAVTVVEKVSKEAPPKAASARAEEAVIISDAVEKTTVKPEVKTAAAVSSDVKVASASTAAGPSMNNAAIMGEIESLRGDMKNMANRFNREIFLLQNKSMERSEIVQNNSIKLFWLFLAFLGESIILVAILFLARRRFAYRESYSGLDNAGVALVKR